MKEEIWKRERERSDAVFKHKRTCDIAKTDFGVCILQRAEDATRLSFPRSCLCLGEAAMFRPIRGQHTVEEVNK